jgi:hypothetical protein
VQVSLVSGDATAPEQSLLSVNVADVDAAYAEGVRRFFVRDPTASWSTSSDTRTRGGGDQMTNTFRTTNAAARWTSPPCRGGTRAVHLYRDAGGIIP